MSKMNLATSTISASLDSERQRAMRAILQQPLLTAGGPDAEEYLLVRRHAQWLKEWFSRHPDWNFQIDSEVARLRKTPTDPADGTRSATEPNKGAPFTKRRYVLLCLALATLEQGERQIVLGKLADGVIELIALDPAFEAVGIHFDLKSQDQRRDLVDVVRLLIGFGVLQRIHGDEQQYLNQSGDVLYNINRPVLAAMLNLQNSPSAVEAETTRERARRLAQEFASASEEGRNRTIRSALVRRLLDDPVLYYDELSADERAYLASQRSFLLNQISQATGLIPEIRREGIAMLDSTGDLTDLGLPEEGTYGHAALLLAEYLAGHAKRNPGQPVGLTELHRYTTELIEEHRSHWRRDAREAGAEIDIVERTVAQLAALRLVRSDQGRVTPLPAIARYALGILTAGGNTGDE
jgi:uncharacterized protein (TIGR02678 family)